MSGQVLERFGEDAYEAALLKAAAVAKQHPHNPKAWNIAWRDELKRILGRR